MALSVTTTVPGEHRLSAKFQVQPGPINTSPLKFRNQRLDPARALEPARKKLASVEAHRVMSVFEDCVQRVQVVTLLPYILQNMDKFSNALGSDLVELLKHHSVIISSYEEINQELYIQLQKRAANRKSLNASFSVAKEGDEDAEAIAGDDNEDASAVQQDAEAGEDRDQDNKEASAAEKQSEEAEADREPDTEDAGTTQPNSSPRSAAEESIDIELAATIRNLSLVAQQMSQSVRSILRAFTPNPAIMTVVKDQLNDPGRDPECQTLIKYLQDLKEILMHKLLTTPLEERERMTYLTEISKRERLNAAVIEKLEQELSVKNEDKEHEILKKNENIRRLQTELHQVEKFSEEHIRRVRADAEKQEAADEKSSEARHSQLQTEVVQFRSKLQNAVLENRGRELELRSKKYKIESEVDNWIMKYDQELGDRQEEYEEIDHIYTEEKKELHELEQRFQILEKEYLGILNARQLVREKLEKEEYISSMTVRAVSIIQAVWRSYKVRKALNHRKKKSPAKKK